MDFGCFFVAENATEKNPPKSALSYGACHVGRWQRGGSGCSATVLRLEAARRCEISVAKGLKNQVSIGFMSFFHICSGIIRKKSRCIKDLLFKRCLLSLFAMRLITIGIVSNHCKVRLVTPLKYHGALKLTTVFEGILLWEHTMFTVFVWIHLWPLAAWVIQWFDRFW